jgi:parallel beta-helix repeat protein
VSIIKKTIYSTIAAILVVSFFSYSKNNSVFAQAENPMLNFAGKVTNTDGSELADGVYDMNYRLYTAPTGGSLVWSEDLTAGNCFSGAISGVVSNADTVVYSYSGAAATGTLRVGQYLYNVDLNEAALIVNLDHAAGTITVAGNSAWNIGNALNNRPFVEGGVINVNLGSVNDISEVDFSRILYLEVVFNGETMQPRKIITSQARAFDAARLAGRSAGDFAALADNETISGHWSFNNLLNVSSSTNDALLTITQDGAGNIAEFKKGTTTSFAVLADGRVQIGSYYFPISRGSAGHILKTDNFGNLYWAPDLLSAGTGIGAWATTTDSRAIHPVDTSQVVIIGNNATSSIGYVFEVDGAAWMDRIDINSQQQLRFYDADNSNYFAIRAAGAISNNFILTFPSEPGTAGKALITDDNGNLSWGAPTGFTYVNPGLAGQMAFYQSDGSTLSAASNLFVSGDGKLGVGTNTPSSLLSIGNSFGSQFLVNENGEVIGGVWLGDPIDIAYGGTGATTTSAARYNLGLAIGSDVQAYDLGLTDISNISSTTLNLIVGSASGWEATSTLAINAGGTGAADASGARTNLGLTNIYNYGIDSQGTLGYVWVGTAGAKGQWQATSTLGLIGTHQIGSAVQAYDAGLANLAAHTAQGLLYQTEDNNIFAATTTLAVNFGGTGKNSWTSGAIPYLSGTGSFGEIAMGGLNQILAVNGSGTGYTWMDAGAVGVDTVRSDEEIMDVIAAMIASGTHARITITYNDNTDSMDFVVDNNLSNYSWDNVTGTHLKVGSITQAYDPGLSAISNISSTTLNLIVGSASGWEATSTLAINAGGTGATDASGARTNLGLTNIYNYGIDSQGTLGYVWVGTAGAKGQWQATSTLGLIGTHQIGSAVQAYDAGLANLAAHTAQGLLYQTEDNNIFAATTTLAVNFGGTGKNSWTSGAIPYLSGTGSFGEIIKGDPNRVLAIKADGSGYEWVSKGELGTARTDEEIMDVIAAMIASGTHARITITYNDNTDSMDFVVDNNLSNYSWDNVTGTHLKVGSITQAYDPGLSAISNISSTTLNLIVGSASGWEATSTLAINAGGTGAADASGARANLGLSNIYNHGIDSQGTLGYVWVGTAGAKGQWQATSTLGLIGTHQIGSAVQAYDAGLANLAAHTAQGLLYQTEDNNIFAATTTLAVNFGGTGKNSWTSGAIPYLSGTGSFGEIAMGGLNQILAVNGSGTGYTWMDAGAVGVDTVRSDEEIMDVIAAMIASGTHARITITYNDNTDSMDFVVDNNLSNYSWDNVTGTHLKVGSITQAYDPGLSAISNISSTTLNLIVGSASGWEATSTLAINAGGTGAADASGARTNLGLTNIYNHGIDSQGTLGYVWVGTAGAKGQWQATSTLGLIGTHQIGSAVQAYDAGLANLAAHTAQGLLYQTEDNNIFAATTTLAVNFGGTGKSSWTSGAIPFLSGTGSFGEIAMGDPNRVLAIKADGSGYEWVSKGELGTARTDEEIMDVIAAMIASGTHARITITYNDNTDSMDFVVDNNLSNYSWDNVTGTHLKVGSITQAYDPGLSAISNISSTTLNLIVGSASGWEATSTLAINAGGTGAADASGARANLGLSNIYNHGIDSQGTLGYVWVGTAGAKGQWQATSTLGLIGTHQIGSAVQAYDAGLANLAAHTAQGLLYQTEDNNIFAATTTLAVNFGGTGKNSWTSGAIPYLSGTGSFGEIAMGGLNQILAVNGSGTGYTWMDAGAVGVDTVRSDEEIMDVIAAMIASGTHARITITYNDNTDSMDFVVDNNLSNYSWDNVTGTHLKVGSITQAYDPGLSAISNISSTTLNLIVGSASGWEATSTLAINAGGTGATDASGARTNLGLTNIYNYGIDSQGTLGYVWVGTAGAKGQWQATSTLGLIGTHQIGSAVQAYDAGLANLAAHTAQGLLYQTEDNNIFAATTTLAVNFGGTGKNSWTSGAIPYLSGTGSFGEIAMGGLNQILAVNGSGTGYTWMDAGAVGVDTVRSDEEIMDVIAAMIASGTHARITITYNDNTDSMDFVVDNNLSNYSWDNVTGTHLKVGSITQAYDPGLSAISNISSTTLNLIVGSASGWEATSTLAINAGGTGATDASGARTNLGLTNIYNYGIDSQGTLGYVWVGTAGAKGQWQATSTLGLIGTHQIGSAVQAYDAGLANLAAHTAQGLLYQTEDNNIFAATTTLAVNFGGTGKSSWTSGAIPFLSGTGSFGEIAMGDPNRVLAIKADGSGYEWVSKGELGTARTDEEIMDVIAAMIASGTHARITITYNDNTDSMDFVVDNNLSNYSWDNVTGTHLKVGSITQAYDPGLSAISNISSTTLNLIVGSASGWEATSTLAINAGGTGAADASGARANLGLSNIYNHGIDSQGTLGYVWVGTAGAKGQWQATSTLGLIGTHQIGSAVQAYDAGLANLAAHTAQGLLYQTEDNNIFAATTTLAVNFGGTGKNSWTSGAIPYLSGTGSFGEIAMGGLNQILAVNGSGTGYTWMDAGAVGVDTVRSDEEIMDVIAAMIASGTHARITITYNDNTDSMDFVVDNNLSNYSWDNVTGTHLKVGSITQAYDPGLSAISNISSTTLNLIVGSASGWEATSTLAINAGGTGATDASGARTNLGLTNIYNYGIDSQGTLGYVWVGTAGAKGQWQATSTLGLIGTHQIGSAVQAYDAGLANLAAHTAQGLLYQTEDNNIFAATTTLAVNFGGTGKNSWTSGAIPYLSGTGSFGEIAMGGLNQILAVNGSGTGYTWMDAGAVGVDTVRSDEEIMDVIAAMIASGTHARITITYNDNTDSMDFVVDNNLSNYSWDNVTGTHLKVGSITQAYDPGLSAISNISSTTLNLIVGSASGWEATSTLAINAGGTGATDASGARTNLGLTNIYNYGIDSQGTLGYVWVGTAGAKGQWQATSTLGLIGTHQIGSAVQAYDAGLANLAAHTAQGLLYQTEDNNIFAATTTLAVNFGGTGKNSWTSGAIPYLSGTGSFGEIAMGGLNQILAVNGSGTGYTWMDAGAVGVDTVRSDEEIMDVIAAMIASGTHARITITYNDNTDSMDFVVDNNLSNYSWDNVTGTHLKVGSITQAYDPGLSAISNISSTTLNLIVGSASGWEATSTLAINAGGTGATDASGARANLGLSNIYNYGIDSQGTLGYVWVGTAGAKGQWQATSTLGLIGTHQIGSAVQAYDAGLANLAAHTAQGLLYQTEDNNIFAATTTLAVNFGGTGKNSWTSGAIPYLSGTGSFGEIAMGGLNQILAVNGSGTGYTWMDAGAVGVDTVRSDEEIMDVIAAMIASGTHARITITYNDNTDSMDFVVDNNLSNYSWDNVTGTHLKVGSITQAYDLGLSAISNISSTTLNLIVGSASGWEATSTLAINAGGTGATDASGARANLGLSNIYNHGIDSQGTLGYVWVGTAGAKGQWQATSTLGLIGTHQIGSAVQAYDAGLANLAAHTAQGLLYQTEDNNIFAATTTLAVNFGGTGKNSWTSGAIPYLSGTGSFGEIAMGGLNQILAVNGSGTGYTWMDAGAVGVDTVRSDEEIMDVIAAMIASGTHARITITYNDNTDSMDFVVDNNLANYSWDNVTGTHLKVGSITQAYDLGLTDISNISSTTLNLIVGSASGWEATSTLAINAGGTGATSAEGARANLGLDNIYTYGITSAGTAGNIWMSQGSGTGAWTSTSTFIFDTDFTANGLIVRTSAGNYDSRTLTGTADEITVSYGDGVSGNPTISLPDNVYLGANGKIGRDADNLIDFSVDNQITFRTNAYNSMVLNSSGQLSVGRDNKTVFYYSDSSNRFLLAEQLPFGNTANLALGFSSLDALVWDPLSHNNTALGSAAFSQLENGSKNIAVGSSAGYNLVSGSENIAIGYFTGFASTTGSYQLNIGNTIYGLLDNNFIGIGTTTPGYDLTVDGNLMVSGALYDNNYSAGQNGYFLRSTGTGYEWSATSSLGFDNYSHWTLAANDSNSINATSGASLLFAGGTGLATAISGNTITISATGGYNVPLTASTTNWENTYSLVDTNHGNWTSAYDIITASSSDWQTAFLWGDHSLAGYLTDGSSITLGSLSDVSTSTLATGHLLMWNGSSWVNTATSSLGISAGGSGIVNAGTTGQLAYYSANGTAVIGTSTISLNDSNQVLILGGTAAAPSLTFAGDTNTGIFGLGSDILGFSTGGAEAFRLDASGNMMIGTTTPGGKLTIMSDSGSQLRLAYDESTYVNFTVLPTGELAIQGPANGNSLIWLGSEIPENAGIIFDIDPSSYWFGADSTDNAFHIGTSTTFGSNKVFTVSPDGNIGIGTTSPVSKLAVDGTATVGSLVLTGGTTFPASPVEGQMFYRSDTRQVYVYTGSRWQADRTTATLIVAASDSANKEKADYICTGTNDDVMIETAIAALPAGGGILHLLEGTYNISNEVNITSNVKMVGAGPSTVLKLAAVGTTMDVIDVASAQNVIISSLRVDGTSGTGGTQNGIYFASTAASSSVVAVEVHNMRNDGFKMGAPKSITIKDSIFRNNIGNGINIYDGSYGQVVNNISRYNGLSGLYSSGGAENWVIDSNIFSNNTTGIWVQDSWRNIISNNQSVLNTQGFFSSDCSYSQIIGNRFGDNISSGINFGGYYNSISDNQVIGNGVGIYTRGNTWDNNFSSNHIMENTDYALNITNTWTSNFTGNFISGGTSATSTVRISSSGYNSFIGNQIFADEINYLAFELASNSTKNSVGDNYIYGTIQDDSATTEYFSRNRLVMEADDISFGGAYTPLTVTQHGTGEIINLIRTEGGTATSTVFTVLNDGSVGIGTSTPGYDLTVDGDIMLTGAIYDNGYSSGSNGQILQSTGSGVQWADVSSLGLDNYSHWVLAADDSNSINATSGASLLFAGGTGLTTAISGNTITISAAGGYNIPLTASTTNWENTYSLVNTNNANWTSAYNIITASSSDWQTAFLWGDHGQAGYLTDGSSITLGSLSDVSTSTLATGHLLMWNGTQWVNTSTSSLGLTGIGESGTVNTGTAGQLAYYSADGTAVIGTSTISLNDSNQVLILGGTAAAPSLTFAGDTNTGIFGLGSDILGFSTGGAEAFRLDASGNMMIGTTTPGGKLTVLSDTGSQLRLAYDAETYVDMTVQSDGRLVFGGSSEGSSVLVLGRSSSENAGIIFSNDINDYWFGIDSANNAMHIGTSTNIGSSSIMTILNSGQIGIGTTTPGYDLTVDGHLMVSGALYDNNYSAGQNGYFLKSTGTGYQWTATSSLGFDNYSHWILAADDANSLNATSGASLLFAGGTGLTTAISGNTITISAAGGYNIPLTASTTNWENTYSLVNTNNANWTSAYNIITASSSDWQTAFLWGDHGQAGYLTDGSSITLGSLSDVSTSTLATGHLLMWNGTQWVNTSTSSLGLTGIGESGTVNTGTAGQLAYYSADGTAVIGTSTISLNDSNQVLILGGTAATPSFTFAGDTNTGIFGLGSDILGFSTGGAEAFRLDASGNMMIGTTTPGGKLTIMSDSGSQLRLAYDSDTYVDISVLATGELVINGSDSIGSIFQIGNNYAEDAGILFDNNPNGYWVGVDSADNAFHIGTSTTFGGNKVFTMLSDGQIGIGTTTPGYDLTVGGHLMVSGALYDNNYSAGQNGYFLRSTGSGYQWTATSSLGFDNYSHWTLAADDSSSLNATSGASLLFAGGTGLATAISGNTITISAAGGYNIPLTASTTNWETGYLWGDHSLAGYITDGSSITLGSLSDVSTSTLATGHLLMWNGAQWVNTATSSLGLQSSGSYLEDSDFSANGIMVRTAGGAYASRTLTGTSNQITVANGDGLSGNPTLSLPSAVYLGASGVIGRDADNLIDFSTDNRLTFRTDGVNRMHLDALGRLAIGTSMASGMLTIMSDTYSQLRLAYDESNYVDFSVDALGQLNISAATTSLGVGSEAMRITGGRVGIGTTTPLAKLSVYGDIFLEGSDNYLNFGSLIGTSSYGIRDNGGSLQYKNSGGQWVNIGSGSGTINSGTAGQIAYYGANGTGVSGTNLITLDNSAGFVGIGTATPDYLLHAFNNNTNDYLAYIYNASSTALSGGGLSIRVDGSGNLLNLNHNGTDVVTISGAQTTFNNPVVFGAAGDVSIAYDLIMGNDTAGNILFSGPGYIKTDSSWQNLDLSLEAANNGEIFLLSTTTIEVTSVGANTVVFKIATGTTGNIFTVDSDGDVRYDGTASSPAADYAEYFYSNSEKLVSGEAVCIDVSANNSVVRCSRIADGNVMGIVSTKPAIVGNAKPEYMNNPKYAIIGMLGQVPAFVSSENGPIRPGDSLTPASTPGYVAKALPGDSTVGVALEYFGEKAIRSTEGADDNDESLYRGLYENLTGKINVLISRRNKSLTVEMVEHKITERIANMEIEDEVQILISQAIDKLDLSDDVLSLVNEQLALFNNELTVEFQELSGEILSFANKIDNLTNRLTGLEAQVGNLSGNYSDLAYKMESMEYILNGFDQTSEPEIDKYAGNLLVDANGNLIIGDIDSAKRIGTSSPESEAAVEIISAPDSVKTAFVVNQMSDNDIADFRYDGISIVNIAQTGKVTIVGEMLVDGRIMVCSGGVCGSALDKAVDETMGDMGVEGKMVAGAFESYCEKGFVWVPGSSKYGTSLGFCVQQNEAALSGSDKTWTNVSQGEAALACQNMGKGYHLITENEWLTIAENILRSTENDASPETDGLQLAVWGGKDLYGIPDNDYPHTATSTAYVLTNGNIIYNFAGGAAEWTDQTITKAGLFEPASEDWQEYYQIENYKGYNIAPPYYYTSSENGIGRVKAVGEGALLRGFVRGQFAVYDLDLSYSPADVSEGIGFRCAR